MAFKRTISACIAICMVAILVVASCGCDDLGEYSNVGEYYGSFEDIVLISATSRNTAEYSVEEYFYNENSRDNFLTGEDGVYTGVEYSDYVYMAIPFKSDLNMDSVSLYLQSKEDVTLYINVYVTDVVPSNWRSMTTNVISQVAAIATDETDESESADESTDSTESTESTESEENDYDDPDPDKRVGDLVVHLTKDKWNSFTLDSFYINGAAEGSIQISKGQYILLQFRNNSGIRIFDIDNQIYKDPQTGLELQRAEITMTNLLIRALDRGTENESEGGE